MTQQRSAVDEYKDKVDFGIITIREDEWDALLKRIPRESLAVGRQTYAISRLKTINDEEYVIASVRCPEPGNGQGQAVARTLIDELNPQWILLVGIAGSMPDYEYTLGDVLVASRLHDFCVSAAIESEDGQLVQQFAAGGGPMMPEVQSLVGSLQVLFLEEWNSPKALLAKRPKVKLTPSNFYGDERWKKKVRACLERYFGKDSIRNRPKFFTGSVASSDTLLKSTTVARQWLSTNRQVKGVEMELAGVYKAAFDYQKPILAIRGISDIVGFERSPDWTEYACHSAAAFTFALLRYQPITPLSARGPQSPRSDREGIDKQDSGTQVNEPVGVFKDPPVKAAPLVAQETLYSNLLEVEYFPRTLYSVETDCENDTAVRAILRNEMFDPPEDWIIRAKTLYAFHDFSDPIWKNVCGDNTPEPQSTSHWAASDDHDRKGEFIDLLKNSLREFGKRRDLKYIHTQKVNGVTKPFKYLYFAPTTEFSKSPLFQHDDFRDFCKFAAILKEDLSPLAEHLFNQLSGETQDLIESYPGTSEHELRKRLVRDLNDVLRNPLYDTSLFEDVKLRWEAKRLLERDSLDEKDLTTLNRMLLEDAYRGILAKRYLATRKVVEKSVVRAAPTEVFKAVFGKTGAFYYYRHHAFRPHFVRYEGKWYLEITPTYHYTWNGHKVTSNYEDQIKGIKRIEGSEAVFRQVMLWARVLQGDKAEFLGQQAYPYLRFGNLMEFPFDYGVPDKLWQSKEIIGVEEEGEPKKGRKRGRRSRKPTGAEPSQSLFA